MAEKSQDRRTRYTLMVIREAFFKLLREKGFEKITVTDVCREANINRGTFYLHYVDKYDLLNAMIDEALDASPPLEEPTLATMCQRPPANDDYQLLYSNNEIFSRVAERVIERGAEEGVPALMEQTGLDEQDARLLFIFSAHGNLADRKSVV